MTRHGGGTNGRPAAVPTGRTRRVFTILAVAGLVGCGNLTAGGAAEVEVVVASDEGVVAEAPRSDGVGGWPSFPIPGSMPVDLTAGLEGTYDLELAVSLLDAGGGVVALTEGVVAVSGPLGSGNRVDVTLQGVPPGIYGGFRATFHRVDAEVSALPGAGPGSGAAEVDLSAGPVTVEAQRELRLEDGDRVRLIIDLRTGAWLHALGTLPPGPFRNAVRFEVEPGGSP